MYAAVMIYFNYKKNATYCLDLSNTGGTGNLGDDNGWDVLACNQLLMPTINGDNSLFWKDDYK